MTDVKHPSLRLVERLGIEVPIAQGGMTFGSDGRLVAAVSAAGGLGTLGTFHYRSFERVAAELEIIRAGTDRPFAVNVPFFENNLPLVRALVEEGGVRVLTLGGWFSDEVAALKRAHDLTVLVSVNSPTVARMVLGQPLDALIVQGNESGGANNRFTTRQLFELLRGQTQAPVLLAGGQWDGLDLHAALLMGAAGVQLGTRFFFAAESPLHPSIKAQVIESNTEMRPLTTALTPVSETLNMRFIQNKAYRQASRDGSIQEIFQDKERVFALSEEFWREQRRPPLIYAGAGVYKLRALQSCAEVIAEMMGEYRRLLDAPLPRF